MPELPEVETVCRTLRPRLVGRTVTGVRLLRPFVANCAPAEFAERVGGRRVEGVRRRGKYIVIELGASPGRPPDDLIFHLMMAGRLGHRPPGAAPPDPVEAKHTHAVFTLDDRSELAWADLRHFGRIHLVPRHQPEAIPPGLAALGPEPLAAGFTAARLASILRRRRAPLKLVLLDQAAVAGLGNIYADESLHRAGLHPLRPACSLDPGEVRALHRSLRAALREAIASGGTTLRTYVDGEGRRGAFQARLRVYGRTGKRCARPGCEGTVERVRVGGRSTHFCPLCQPPRTAVRNSR
ncbi:MAG: bifunctional DNA-formamidopyrimidine glycosylase/DNA-(apurinic or apyrimidinic site) lyase [bacterium]|nr:bifunctional DNA-formamidopyrimidine glycosylase/DNA-(apurinic or apyrimidinic site) lyase [bacterium]